MTREPHADARGEVDLDSVSAPPRTRATPGLRQWYDPTPVEFMQLVKDVWVQWSVVEVDASAVPGARATRCLLFSRPDCIRRVWDYPADWRTLDHAGLTALSWHR
jgi:hypothetical protein